MKFLELFEPIRKGNFGLTEEAVYRSIQLGNKMIPLWGGNQEHIHADRFVDERARTKYDEPITIFDGEGIIISLDGSSGNMTYKQNVRFALNHHAGFFQVNRMDLIDPRFFSIFYQQQLRAASISEGSKTLTLDSIYGLDFEVPSRPLQEKLMSEIGPILKRKQKINKLISKISLLRKKSFSVDYKNYQARGVPIGVVFNCMNGNTGLTEKEVYQRICDPGNRYRILSSATSDETELGFVPIFHLNGKTIKVFEGMEGILVSRNGKAGSSIFLPAGKYTLTDHAYILYLRVDCPYNVNIKWFVFEYGNVFLEYTSGSDNATWDMTGFFREMFVDIPSVSEQEITLQKYSEIEILETRLKELDAKIENLVKHILSE